MKKSLTIVLMAMVIGSSPLANTNKLPYSTEMIGNFMGFCINVLGTRLMGNGMSRELAIQNSSEVCSCVMDSYRKNNDEAEFLYEFHTKDYENVHLFTQYLNECMDQKFNQQETPPKQSIIY